MKVANSSDIALAVAVFGKTVLASDTTLSDLYQMFVPKKNERVVDNSGCCGGCD